MDKELKFNDSQLLDKFLKLNNIDDFCELLDVNKKTLLYLLYGKKIELNYKSFEIKKKSGGTRTIRTPITSLKIIQQKLSVVLSLVYGSRLRPSVHGFCKDMSIVTNAAVHCGKKVVLNFDLENFFPSISFPRVMGLFTSNPFNLPKKVAAVLAQICTLNNELPQGAPTSPIISNLICSRLDGQMQKLAKRNNILYTRYADDITLSSWSSNFPKNIATLEKSNIILGKDLEAIIASNWFSINRAKTRISFPSARQEVTGLTTNKFPNIKRDYVREIRVMLYNWEHYGIEKAKERYLLQRKSKDKSPYKPDVKFEQVILGKINFVRMVRGSRNNIYKRLINKYNTIAKNGYPELELNEDKILEDYIWIIEVNDWEQGTGFLLEGYGMITCSHVLGIGGKIIAYRPKNPIKKYPLQLLKNRFGIDLAILEFEESIKFPEFKKSNNQVNKRDSLLGIGFPLLYSNKEPFFYETKVVSFKERFFLPRIVLDKPFTGGMSGSPLLNNKNEVVGVIATGSKSFAEADDVIGYTATPIGHIDL